MKKKYLSPQLNSVRIDNTITLVMYSNEDSPPPPPQQAPANSASSFKSESFEKSPFKEK